MTGTDLEVAQPDGDSEPIPAPPTRRGRRWGLVLAVALAVALVLAAVLGLWVERQVNPASAGETVSLTVATGATVGQVASLLEDRGVVGNAVLFRLYVRFEGSRPFLPGDYQLRKRERFSTLVAALTRPPAVDRLTIPEGLTLVQIAERVGRLPGRSADRFLALARNGQVRSPYAAPNAPPDRALEGLLFPDTYEVERTADELTILQRLVDGFDTVAGQVGLDQASTRVPLTPYQAVIVASMVEREAKVPGDRGPIARVIYNRLQRNLPLQIDATVIYALGGGRSQVLDQDLKVASPYNTYLNKGLPPTPIAAPGRAALQAALAPPPGPWLYYVVVGPDGKHAFATTLEEQNRNIALAHQRGLR